MSNEIKETEHCSSQTSSVPLKSTSSNTDSRIQSLSIPNSPVSTQTQFVDEKKDLATVNTTETGVQSLSIPNSPVSTQTQFVDKKKDLATVNTTETGVQSFSIPNSPVSTQTQFVDEKEDSLNITSTVEAKFGLNAVGVAQVLVDDVSKEQNNN